MKIEGFRNISALSLSPCETVNIFYGDNAQGKTNLIEAIWLFSGSPSFRGAKNAELIRFDEDFSRLCCDFSTEKRTEKIEITMSRDNRPRKISLNGVPLATSSELTGSFYCVVFSPVHLSLIKDGPKNRRKFLDTAISQITPQYKNYLSIYEQALLQRNALLKRSNGFRNFSDTLEVWDRQLAKTGTILSIYRSDYVKKLSALAQKIYDGLSNSKEKLSISYISTAFPDFFDIKEYDESAVSAYLLSMKEKQSGDIALGFTQIGPHKDDLEVFINDKSARAFGSQGQQRSAAIALKLAEAELLKRVTKENPIMLLDDVMSELDIRRQDYILNHVKNLQVFITCCDVVNTKGLQKGKIFKIKDGELISQAEI